MNECTMNFNQDSDFFSMEAVTISNELLYNKVDFKSIYVTRDQALKQTSRYIDAISRFLKTFKYSLAEGKEIQIYSAPGRTEIGGNHTDHQRGKVLAAAINRDAIAITLKTNSTIVRVKSEGFELIEIDTNDLAVRESENGQTDSLIRGVMAELKSLGYIIGGFDAYITSDVLVGAGLSSSAAFETLVGTIISGLFNDGKIDPVIIAKVGQKAENNYFGKPCGLMDQMASSVGSLVYIDFADPDNPVIEKIDFPFDETSYSLCITNTHGSHADLTNEYASVPEEMKSVAGVFNKEYLNEVTTFDILMNLNTLREQLSDRAVLRALHFCEETNRAHLEAQSLKDKNFDEFIRLVKKSGESSYKYLQNVYVNSEPEHQNVSIALCISDIILSDSEANRVHGGGFAGTIQAFVRNENVENYKNAMDSVFGKDSCEVLAIRPFGGMRIV